ASPVPPVHPIGACGFAVLWRIAAQIAVQPSDSSGAIRQRAIMKARNVPMNHTDPKLSRTDAAWLDAHWMPFTGNRQFKAHPRMLVAAEGAYYTDADGRKTLDGLSGLWCTGLGHGRREITEAIARQAAMLDY